MIFYSVLQGIMSENVNNFHWWNDGKLSSRMIEFSHESFVIIKKPTDMIWSLLQLSNIKIINHVEDSRCMLWPATRNKHATESKHHTNLKWRQHSNSNERIQRWLGTRTLNWLLYGPVKVKPMTINHLKQFVSIWFFFPSPRLNWGITEATMLKLSRASDKVFIIFFLKILTGAGGRIIADLIKSIWRGKPIRK